MGAQSVGSQIVWADIPCVDLDRAIAFYGAVLDCEISREGGGGFEMGILPHATPAVGACLAVMKDTAPSESGPLLYFNCDGRLQEAVDRVPDAGGTVLVEIHTIGPHGKRAIVRDSEGNRIALHSG